MPDIERVTGGYFEKEVRHGIIPSLVGASVERSVVVTNRSCAYPGRPLAPMKKIFVNRIPGIGVHRQASGRVLSPAPFALPSRTDAGTGWTTRTPMNITPTYRSTME